MNLLDMVAKLSFEDGEFQSGVSKAGTSITGLGKVIAGVVSAGAILKLGKDAVTTGMNFDSAMSQVAATMGLTQDEINQTGGTFEQLRKKALEMGSSTKYSASQSAEALNYLALAGIDAETSMKALPVVLQMAGASGIDLATTSDKLTNIMGALGLASKDSTEYLNNMGSVTDVLAITSTKANTDVMGLFESISTVGSTARNMVDPVTELSIATGILADNDITASEAGTHLRNIIMSLATPTDKASLAMEELGLQVYDANGELRPMQDILLDLNDKMSDMTTEEKMNMINRIFNKTDISAVNALLNNCGDRWDELHEAIEECEGAAEQMYKTQNDNLKGSLTELSSAVEGLQIAISDILTPAIRPVVEWLTKFAQELTKVISGSEDANPVLKILTGVILSLATAFATVKIISVVSGLISLIQPALTAISMVKSLSGAMSILNFVFLSNPIGIVIGLIAGLTAGFVFLWNTSEGFREFWINLWETIKNVTSIAFEVIGKFFTETVPQWIENMGRWFSELPTRIGEGLSNTYEAVKTWTSEMWNKFLEMCTNIFNSVIEWFSQLPYNIGYWLSNGFFTVVDYCDKISQAIWDLGVYVLNTIIEFFSQLPGKIWEFLKSAWDNISQWSSDVRNKFIEMCQNVLNTVVEWFSQLPGKMWTWLLNTLQKASEFAVNLKNKALEAGRWFLETLINAVSNLPNEMFNIGKNIVQGVWNGIKSMASTFSNNVKSFFSGIVDGAKSALGIHSPSREMRDEVGKWIPAGVGVGIERSMPDLEKQLEEDMNNLTNVKFTPKVDTTAELVNSMNSISQRNIEVQFNVDGREFNRQVVAPYQEEVQRYNSVRNVR